MVTLAKIYILAQKYQTLVREIATPTIPDFIEACLHLIHKSSSDAPLEVIFNAFAALIPLYSPTFRPFVREITSAAKPYMAPTLCDSASFNPSLSGAARDLIALLPHSAAKNGSSDEWSSLVQGLLKSLHLAADQVFRCVNEQYSTTFNYARAEVNFNSEPSGGGMTEDDLPPWIGLRAGCQRLVGLLDCLGSTLSVTTKLPVTIPVSIMVETCTRISFISRPSDRNSSEIQSLEYDPSASREEKDLLFRSLPPIHERTILLLTILVKRLDISSLPYLPEIFDGVNRVLSSSRDHLPIRKATYSLYSQLLCIGGTSLTIQAVETFELVILSVCRDLNSLCGCPTEAEGDEAVRRDPAACNPSWNPDQYLKNSSAPGKHAAWPCKPNDSSPAEEALVSAAKPLLIAAFVYLPQQYLRTELRCLMDRTAVNCRIKDAMVASVLNPFPGKNGKYMASVLPYLAQQFPYDREVDVLRTNIRTKDAPADGLLATSDKVHELLQDDDQEAMRIEEQNGPGESDAMEVDTKPSTATSGKMTEDAEWPFEMAKPVDAASDSLAVRNTGTAETSQARSPQSPLKRKFEAEVGSVIGLHAAKKEKVDVISPRRPSTAAAAPGESSDSDGEEPQLVMQFDSDTGLRMSFSARLDG